MRRSRKSRSRTATVAARSRAAAVAAFGGAIGGGRGLARMVPRPAGAMAFFVSQNILHGIAGLFEIFGRCDVDVAAHAAIA